jgi:hypothetical protein
VANRLALLQLGAVYLEGALLPADGTRPSALGTGLLLAQGVGLLFQERLQSAFGEAGGGGVGDLLHGIEIDIEPRPLVAEGAAGDNFTPLSGEAVEFLEFLGGEGAACHDASCVGVEISTKEKGDPVRLRRRT